MTGEFFPDVLLNNWTDPWSLFRNNTSDCVFSPLPACTASCGHSAKDASCEMIPQLILNQGGRVDSSSKQGISGFY